MVLSIDSRGGNALASQAVFHEVMRFRRSGKPVVVCLGNNATSGAYLIAAAANQILALPVTGSIGAYSKAVDRSGFAKALGMEEDGVLAGKNAMLLPECANMSKAQRKQLNAQTERHYAAFLRNVAEGRGMTVAQVEKVAEGRLWSGRDALKHGLVDQMGGYFDAVATAKELAKLPKGVGAVQLVAVDDAPSNTIALEDHQLSIWESLHIWRRQLMKPYTLKA
ncbi:hypothetical protein ABBQ38_013100 [Trebouxia sp. C0009 RCD-2024]